MSELTPRELEAAASAAERFPAGYACGYGVMMGPRYFQILDQYEVLECLRQQSPPDDLFCCPAVALAVCRVYGKMDRLHPWHFHLAHQALKRAIPGYRGKLDRDPQALAEEMRQGGALGVTFQEHPELLPTWERIQDVLDDVDEYDDDYLAPFPDVVDRVWSLMRGAARQGDFRWPIYHVAPCGDGGMLCEWGTRDRHVTLWVPTLAHTPQVLAIGEGRPQATYATVSSLAEFLAWLDGGTADAR